MRSVGGGPLRDRGFRHHIRRRGRRRPSELQGLGCRLPVENCRPAVGNHRDLANSDGSRVSSRFRITGRNNGMFGLPADRKPVALTGNAILAVTPTGKLAHNWVEPSAWELYHELKD